MYIKKLERGTFGWPKGKHIHHQSVVTPNFQPTDNQLLVSLFQPIAGSFECYGQRAWQKLGQIVGKEIMLK